MLAPFLSPSTHSTNLLSRKAAQIFIFINACTIIDYWWKNTSQVKLIVSSWEGTLEDWSSRMGQLMFLVTIFELFEFVNHVEFFKSETVTTKMKNLNVKKKNSSVSKSKMTKKCSWLKYMKPPQGWTSSSHGL